MRNLSLWAKHHLTSARIIIIISRCILFFIACFLGMQLSEFHISVSPVWIFLLIIVFVITCIIYPAKKSANNFSKRKLSDLVVACSGFLLTISVVTQLNKPFTLYSSAQATSVIEPSPYKNLQAQKLLEQFKNGEKTTFTHKEKRIIKNEFKYQLGQYAKAKITGNKEAADHTLLIILACIAAVGLLYLVAAIACGISCNGSDAGAIIVLVIGTAAVIWGLIAVIKAIKRKRLQSE